MKNNMKNENIRQKGINNSIPNELQLCSLNPFAGPQRGFNS